VRHPGSAAPIKPRNCARQPPLAPFHKKCLLACLLLRCSNTAKVAQHAPMSLWLMMRILITHNPGDSRW